MTPDSLKNHTLINRRFISFDETPIFYHYLKLAAEPRAVVLMVHGLGEHGGRYLPLAEHLSKFGIESVVMDLRGFGRSGGKKACVKHFSDYYKDLEALHLWIARTRKNTPLFILGHSFGGLIVSSYAASYGSAPVTGLILSSPLFGIAIPVPLWRNWLAIILSYCLPNLTQATMVNPELLTHDREILKQYDRDAHIFHKISARLYREMIKTIKQNSVIANALELPTLLLQAGEDYIVSKSESLKFYDQLQSPDKELKVYEGFYHEILNEIKRGEVYSQIQNWIFDRCDYFRIKEL